MINHFRTLLLNRSAPNFSTRPGEEYIPDDFAAMALPTYLQNIRVALFGSNPDWLFENYRVHQYTSLVHSTELEEFVLALDPRITYDPLDTEFFSEVFGAHAGKAGLHLFGEPLAPDASGKSILRWKVELLDSDTASVEQITPISQTKTVEFKSEPLTDGLWMHFNASPGTIWTLEYNRRPQRSLGEIVAGLESTTAQYWNRLFGVGSARAVSEPWQTFRNLWLLHPELPYRLGGFLLAFVYAIELERQNNA